MTGLSDTVTQLSARALAVCRRYLPNGQRVGNYWVVGDARNAPGRSMYVRLSKDYSGRPAGRWTDAATGEFGDLLDIIRLAMPSGRFVDALAEAEAFVGGMATARHHHFRTDRPRRSNHMRQARSLYAGAGPIEGTLGETYLLARAIDPVLAPGLRFVSDCYCRPSADSDRAAWPAMIAPLTDDNGVLAGVHRLYLDPSGPSDLQQGKAPLERPKRSLGRVHGNAVRFGTPAQMIAVAEGLENALSIRTAMPSLTCHAALTAGNLASYRPLGIVSHLLIAMDDDDTGRWAAQALADRSRHAGLSVTILKPHNEDHNRDLRVLGLDVYRASLLEQLQA